MTPYAHSRLGLSAAVLAVTLSGCSADAGSSASPATVAFEDSPAGEGSGEPFLSTSGDAVFLSWLEAAEEGGHDLWVSRRGTDGWEAPRHVAYGDRFFVNWADFPSVVPTEDGTLWAHWLQRGAAGGYDYGVRVAYSTDVGASWSTPWTLHDDDTPTEHGFVTLLPMGNGVGAIWLDGREYAPTADGSPASDEMTLRFRALSVDGSGPEILLDGRTCDCCQTDAAMTDAGPVVVYRDRSAGEIRDIYLTRLTDAGWTEGRTVHADGWHQLGCPVNGPAVAARGNSVAVAWFTAPDDVPRVQVAFSSDGGDHFGAPLRVDDGDPMGRVDLVMLPDGSALVSWLERTGGEAAEIRVRRASPTEVGASHAVTSSSAARASGFPRMVSLNAGSVLIAWTDLRPQSPARVRVARVEVPGS